VLRLLKSPNFWRKDDGVLVKLLTPISKAYALASSMRMGNTIPETATVPVICVGNVVIGGSGKTPTVGLVCDILKSNEHHPHILSSGYGGYLKNVVKVDPAMHSYLQVGDESLLSANVVTTWIGKNRVNAAKAATLAGADVLVVDDGFQNNSLVQNLKIMVVDSGQQFGNERLFPAGPLRETVEAGIKKADVILIIGDKNEHLVSRIQKTDNNARICYAKAVVMEKDMFDRGEKVIGFCGLGYPEKFRKTLSEIGFDIKDFIIFADHHPYTITESQKLIKAARNAGAKLVTTMKDYVKVPDVFKHEITVINIKLQLEDETLTSLLHQTMESSTCKPE
jgi:tetraacyldisaccharide 4'-kinase